MSVQNQHDMAKVVKIAAQVSALDQQLCAASKEAAQINTRESLLGRPVTDYGQVKQLAEIFDPFVQFWTTAAAWRVSEAGAMAAAQLYHLSGLWCCARACRWAVSSHAQAACCALNRPSTCMFNVCCCVPVQAHHTSWVSDPLEQVDAEAVEKEVQAAHKVLYRMSKVCAHKLEAFSASQFVLTAASHFVLTAILSARGLSVTGTHGCALF